MAHATPDWRLRRTVIFTVAGYFYKQYILGQPQEMASVLAKLSTATTLLNAVVSVVLTTFVYNALRPALSKAGLMNHSAI